LIDSIRVYYTTILLPKPYRRGSILLICGMRAAEGARCSSSLWMAKLSSQRAAELIASLQLGEAYYIILVAAQLQQEQMPTPRSTA